MVKTGHFYARVQGSIPGKRTKVPQAKQQSQKIVKVMQ